MKHRTFLALLAAFSLLVAACGSDDSENTEAADDAESAEATDDPESTEVADNGESAEASDDEVDCTNPPTKVDGTLTVATGEAVFPPWMIDDDPSNGQGFESAVVYAVAAELGIENVEWVSTGFDEAIAPGEKNYDFNIQQYSITPERDEVVDFSTGYYEVEQAIIGSSDSPAASATSIEELKELRLGAAIGTTSLDYVDSVIEPDEAALVFDDNAAAKAAFDAGQVDGIVFDLPTAFFITAVEITDASIIGVLPRSGDDPEELGMLFEDGSPLVACVNEALATLGSNGELEAIETKWLNDDGAVPTLS